MRKHEELEEKSAPCITRSVAFCIDGCFNFVPCYFFWKDNLRHGQSFGKRLFGLRVVNFSDGKPITLSTSCMRNCCFCCPCLALKTKSKRRLGDYFAGTIVIKDT
ncbi:MAG: RDD family protein [Candidatus Heimdallarchaeota archaeon]|nr:RDD family protein [Candidatus Heimdallarchaeota archaeon]